MPASLHLCADAECLKESVAAHFKGMPSGVSRVLVVPASYDVDSWRKYFAAIPGHLSFNMKIMTMKEYFDEKWELFGDGSSIARSGAATIVMLSAVESLDAGPDGQKLPSTPGTVGMLVQIAAKGFGTPGIDRMLDEADDLSTAEGRIWAALRRYRSLLHGRKMVEQGEALGVLAEAMPASPVEVVAGFDTLTSSQIAYLEKRGASVFFERGSNDAAFAKIDELVERFSQQCRPEEGQSPRTAAAAEASAEIVAVCDAIYGAGGTVEPTGDVMFAFSTGKSVEPQLIAESVAELIRSGTPPEKLFVADDALPYGFEVQRRLWQMGISSCGMYSASISQTMFGKAFSGLMGDTPDELSDFALSPFSGISTSHAYVLGAKWLGIKGIAREDMLADIAAEGKTASQVVAAVKSGSLADVCAVMAKAFERRYSRRAGGGAGRGSDGDDGESARGDSGVRSGDVETLLAGVSRNVAETTASVMSLGLDLGIDPAKCLSMLAIIAAGGRYQIIAPESDESSCVTFGKLSHARAEMHDAVVIPGLTAEKFPVAKDLDVGSALLAKVGVPPDDDYLGQKRFAFHSALRSARHKLVLSRRLNDDKGSEERPSVLLEELVDCYRADLEDFDALDKVTMLPASMVEGNATGGQSASDGQSSESGLVTVMDEGDLSKLVPKPAYQKDGPVTIANGMPEFPIAINPVEASKLAPSDRKRIAAAALGTPDSPRTLSPTFVELYMECPYKWFVDRMVNPRSLRVSMDPMAMGNYIHGVLRLAYQGLDEQAGKPVRTDSVDRASLQDLVARCSEEFIAIDLETNSDSPFASLTEIEKRDIGRLNRQALNLLVDDREFLRGFVPSRFEMVFGDSTAFEYAGRRFTGIVDRIDFDERGQNAVVIDYKGKLGDAYWCIGCEDPSSPVAEACENLPVKIQSLIYATVAKREMGLNVVGSIYRSYSKRKTVAGAYSNGVLGPEHLFGNKKLHEATSQDFDELMELVEKAVETAIASMAEGNIAPAPRSVKSCEHCNAIGCPKKRGK